MLKKEIVIFTETNEEGEFIKVNRLDTDPGFFLLTLGQNRMVINGDELIEALQTIDRYGMLFDEETRIKTQRAAAPPKTVVLSSPTPAKKSKRVNPEDEGALVLDPIMRLGPTESELALERQTKHMQGASLILKEK
jgi:hypothetical protein